MSVTDPFAQLFGTWSAELNIYSIILRLGLAFTVGALIGAERSCKHHTAGMRTNILVCVGSCVAMMINLFICGDSDAARLGAAVLTGVGFIGAGSIIITSRFQVTGVTTAAALWSACCISLAAGCGLYTVAVFALIAAVVCLVFLPKLEKLILYNSRGYELHIELFSEQDLPRLVDFVREKDIDIKSLNCDPSFVNTGLSVYSVYFYANGKKYIKAHMLAGAIGRLDYVHHVDIM